MIRDSVKRLHAYVPGEQPSGTGIVKLNTNENPYPPSPRVAAALRELTPANLSKYPPPAAQPLRERIADVADCPSDHVFVGNGSDEILALCTRAFVENNGSIGYLTPSYSLYPVLADIRDVPHQGMPLAEDFRWSAETIPPVALFYLANPNAPTSLLAPPATVAAACTQATGVVVVDEAYVDFADADCLSLAGEHDNVLVVRTLSKSFSLAGLRLGYAVGSPPLIDALMKIKDSYNVGLIAQQIGHAALSDLPHMRTNVARIRRTRTRLTAALRDRGFRVANSQTNFVWTQPGTGSTADLFDALRKRNVLVRYFTGERVDRYLRITVGTDEQIDRLIDAIDAIQRG